MAEQAIRTAESLGHAQRRRLVRTCTQAAEVHQQMVQARSERRWHAHAADLNMSGSVSFAEGANDDDVGPSVSPPPGMF